MKLNDAAVLRGGISTDKRTIETRTVEIEGRRPGLEGIMRLISFRLYMASKGGGTTSVKLEIGPKSFAQVLGAMLEADREATIDAFARAILDDKKKK